MKGRRAHEQARVKTQVYNAQRDATVLLKLIAHSPNTFTYDSHVSHNPLMIPPTTPRPGAMVTSANALFGISLGEADTRRD